MTRTRKRLFLVVLLTMTLLAGGQFANRQYVKWKLCGEGPAGESVEAKIGAVCAGGIGLFSFDAILSPSGVSALLTDTVPVKVDAALLRRSCNGEWLVAPGARIDAGPIEVEPFSSERICVDALRNSMGMRVFGGRLSDGGCSVVLDTLSADWGKRLTATTSASLSESHPAACAARLAALPEQFALGLSHVRLEASVDTDLAFGASSTSEDGGTATRSAGGWLRQFMETRAATLTLDVLLPGAAPSLRITSNPGTGGADASPEITLDLHVPDSLRPALVDKLNQSEIRTNPLSLRWNLDHDTGRVSVNEREYPRLEHGRRPSGKVSMERECGTSTGTLYFVEADEDGKAVDATQTTQVFDAIKDADSGALVSVFVHGWQHSAASGDTYVCDYARVVHDLATMERAAALGAGRKQRAVIGVYVGWPGTLYGDDLADGLTFWNRLQIADKLGAEHSVLRTLVTGAAQQVEARQSADPRPDRRSALIVAGHSMGGRAVFHGLQREITQPQEGDARPDLVLLINPAFSANLYRTAHEQARQCQPLGMRVLSFSSEHDVVTRRLYPAGQTMTFERGVSRWLEHIYTAANFDEYVTHRLGFAWHSADEPTMEEQCSILRREHGILRGFKRVPKNSGELRKLDPITVYRQPLDGYPASSDALYQMGTVPIAGPDACPAGSTQVITVDHRILPDHGTIFTPPFVEYVVRVVNRQVSGSTGQEPEREGPGSFRLQAPSMDEPAPVSCSIGHGSAQSHGSGSALY
jgi:hypothetical protein